MKIENCLIVEDELLYQDLLSSYLKQALPKLLTLTFVESLAAAKNALQGYSFDLLLIDISLPDGRGSDLIDFAKSKNAESTCVMVTIADDNDTVFEALQCGADGYLLKSDPGSVLIARLEEIVKGVPPISSDISRKILKHFQANKIPAPDIHLTPRETEILRFISQGLNRVDIAGLLKLSPHTIADYIKSIYRKLDVSSRAEATRMAIRLGLG